jgi:8-oxo-dGTP pyrophosphatase MutT (NUDIX family)
MKLFKAAISHNDSRCDVCYEDADHFNDIPDELITKAHGVCFWNDQLLLVHHPKWDIWGIPGGTREENESILETLVREIKEETNCKV